MYYGPGTLIVVLTFLVAFLFMKPAPSHNLIIGTGDTDGEYSIMERNFGRSWSVTTFNWKFTSPAVSYPFF
jgi:hypothetical protein